MAMIVKTPTRLYRVNDPARRNGTQEFHRTSDRVSRLPVDIYGTDEEFVITAAVPGVNAEDITLTVEDDKLVISGELPVLSDDQDYLLAERYHGPFRRTLSLNTPVEVDGIEATVENGILTVILPKAEEARPKVIKVQAVQA